MFFLMKTYSNFYLQQEEDAIRQELNIIPRLP